MKIKLNWTAPKTASHIAIGNFDGLHIGHHSIIDKLIKQGTNETKLIITFEPHPLVFLQTKEAPKRIIDLRTKCELLQDKGIDQVNIFHFNQTLATTTAEEFVAKLKSELKMKSLVVGEDFRFGHKRQGDVALLKQLSSKYDFDLIVVNDVNLNQQRVSSKLIRNTLADNNFTLANNILNREYYFAGRVIYGQQMGKKLGYPTMNIRFNGELPLRGIYITKVLIDEKIYVGAMSIGTRPAVGGEKLTKEVYVLNYNDNAYGKIIKIYPQEFLRAEMNFNNMEELKLAIKEDVAKCYEFKEHNN